MRRLAILAAGTAAILAMGAPAQAANRGGFYIHDAALAAKTDAADAAIQGADADKPFTDQLATLKADAAKEDLAVARFYVAWRDRNLSDVLAAPAWAATARPLKRRHPSAAPPAGGPGASQWDALNRRVCLRLDELLGGGACGPAMSVTLQKLVASPGVFDRSRLAARQATITAQSWRLRYEAKTPPDQRKDDDCATLLADAKPNGELGLVWANCDDAAAAARMADNVVADALITRGAGAKGGELQRDQDAVFVKAPPAGGALSAAEAKARADIDAQIRAAEIAARDKGWIAPLQKDVLKALSGLSWAAQAARWKQVKDDLDAMRQAIVCGAGSPDCPAIEPLSAAGRARAVWSALEAVNQLQLAGNDARRSARWLTAARAVASAQEDDAALRAADDVAKAANARLILFARLREAADLAQARQDLAAWSGPRSPYGVSRALPLYAASWNEGRIPAAIDGYHDIQRFRETSVLRTQAIVDRQQTLVKSASASLRAYGDAGFTQDELSKVFQNAVLLGIAVK